MNNFIKQVIEEKFVSIYNQKYSNTQHKGNNRKEKKLAKEFSEETDFEKLSKKVDEEELDEIVDEKGNIARSKKPANFNTKGVTQKKISDKVVKTGGASMGTHGVHGTHTSLRYWAENRQELKKLIETVIYEVEMDDALGYKETLGKDMPYKKALNILIKRFNLSSDEAKDRLAQMGYNEKLKGDKINLIENPNKYIEEFIESILSKRNSDYELVNSPNREIKEINPIVKRQIQSFKETLSDNNLSLEDVMEYLKNNE